MYTKIAFSFFLFFAWVNPLSANIDPIHQEGNEQISPGVYARSSAAAQIRKLQITQEISRLYHTLQPQKKDGHGVELAENECFAVYIRTANGIREFIEQIFIKDPTCINK